MQGSMHFLSICGNAEKKSMALNVYILCIAVLNLEFGQIGLQGKNKTKAQVC